MPVPVSAVRGRSVASGGVDYPARWGVVAHWKLDEASGTRNDSHSTNHLTDNNTVTQAAGKVGNAAQFTSANSEYLSIADNAALSTSDIDFWVAAWVYLDTKGGVTESRRICGQYDYGNNQRAWQIAWDGSVDRFRFVVSPDGTSAALGIAIADALGAPSTGTWYFVLGWHDSVNNTVNIRVNDGTTNSAAHSTGVHNSTAEFRIGSLSSSGSVEPTNQLMNGRIDSVPFGKSPPGGIAGVISEISSRLYNGGSGRSFPWN